MTVKALKKPSLFWIIYGAAVLLIVAAVVTGLCLLSDYLEAYEASQPIHSAEKVYEEYFVTEKYVDAMALAGFETGEFETRETAALILAAKKEGKVLSYYATGADEETASYNVVFADQSEPQAPADFEGDASSELAVQSIPSTKIATIRLKRSAEEGKWGFKGWEFDSLEMFLKPTESVKFTVPSTSSVTVNGKAVAASYLVESAPHRFNEFLPEGVEGITLNTYEITGLFTKPVLTCTDKNGLEQTLTLNEESGIVEASLNYDATLLETYGQRMLTGMQEYAKYMQDDGSLYEVRKYFDTASMFYRNIYENPSYFVWTHQGYYFKDEYVGEFYAFDENTFVCHVSFGHYLKLAGREDYHDPMDFMVFARKKGNNFYIYDRILL
ncbi:MAG: hypothetical protein IJC84_01320 [Clostridia bacterium]|nr:hypothetical protein [Clostridia bacterium]